MVDNGMILVTGADAESQGSTRATSDGPRLRAQASASWRVPVLMGKIPELRTHCRLAGDYRLRLYIPGAGEAAGFGVVYLGWCRRSRKSKCVPRSEVSAR